ncbi:MAG: hypothetical protein IPN36_18900 [Bacteroidetes bacterium]|jgi:hypothetical protein|nr:hypothetical protein [Bacteroidota bacterium]
MMRIALFSFLLLLLSTTLPAQGTEKNSSIVLIPFLPEFYLSDAERDIMAQTHRSPDEYRYYFRKTLDLKIQAELEELGVCHSMLQDTTNNGKLLLEKFYEKAGYSYSEPVGTKSKKENIFSKISKSLEETPDQHTSEKVIIGDGEQKFMQAEIKDTALLNSICSNSQSHLIVSINQFEIRTNYKTCIDISNKIYERDLIIHYSIFNTSGKQLKGNYIAISFPSNSSSDREIGERLFPEIGRVLRQEIEKLNNLVATEE